VTIEGNSISCDGFACRTRDTFDGELRPEDVELRYTILGWQFGDIRGHEMHFCPDHP